MSCAVHRGHAKLQVVPYTQSRQSEDSFQSDIECSQRRALLLRLILRSSSSSVVSLDRFWPIIGLVLELKLGGVMRAPKESLGQSSTSCFPHAQGGTSCISHMSLILRRTSISTSARESASHLLLLANSLFFPSCFSRHIWLARARMRSRREPIWSCQMCRTMENCHMRPSSSIWFLVFLDVAPVATAATLSGTMDDVHRLSRWEASSVQ